MTRRIVLAWFLSCIAGIFTDRQLIETAQSWNRLSVSVFMTVAVLLAGGGLCAGMTMALFCGRIRNGERLWSGRRYWYGLAAAAWFAAGVFACQNDYAEPMRQELEKLDSSQMQGIGRIEKVSEKDGRVTIQLGDIYLEDTPASHAYKKFPKDLHLVFQRAKSFYFDRENSIVTKKTEKTDWIPGQQIAFIGEYKQYEKSSNPGCFDYREYCYSIGVAGCVQAEEQDLQVRSGKSRLQTVIWNVRQKIRSRILTLAEEKDRGILLCIMTGDKSELTDYWKKLYQDGGIIHLLTISGLHISILGMGFYRLLKRLSGSFLFSSAAAGVMTAGFCVMAGSGTSMVRAVICFWLYLLSGYVGKSYDLLTAVSFSGLLLLMQHPLLLFQSGFLMTFGCMMGVGVLLPLGEMIFLQERSEETTERGGKKSVLDACLIQLASLPVMLWFQGTWSVFGVWINLAAVPFMSLVLLSVLAAVGLGSLFQPAGIFLLGTAHYILRWYEWLCLFTEQFPGAVQTVGRPGWQQLLIWFAALTVILFFGYRNVLLEKRGLPWLCGLLLLPVSVWCLGRWPDSRLIVSFLDVGQGDGIVMEMPGNRGTVCIDGGSSSEKKLAEYVYDPFFRYEGIGHVEYWILTHPDADHYSGMLELLESGYKIEHILMPEVFQNSELAEKIEQLHPIDYIGTGAYLEMGEIRLDFVHPENVREGEMQTDAETDKNDQSAVVLLTWGARTMLFTGDMGTEAEEEVLAELRKRGIGNGNERHLEILKAAHHGSKSSTSAAFLDCLEPELAVISAGRNNRYGHPHQETLDRLENVGTEWINTAESGCVQILAEKSGYTVNLFLPSVSKMTWNHYSNPDEDYL